MGPLLESNIWEKICVFEVIILETVACVRCNGVCVRVSVCLCECVCAHTRAVAGESGNEGGEKRHD